MKLTVKKTSKTITVNVARLITYVLLGILLYRHEVNTMLAIAVALTGLPITISCDLNKFRNKDKA